MLKKILQDMYVPEEILNNLKEDDKQLLFFEIRKEQIRRFKEFDLKNPCREEFRHVPNKRGKNVGFVSEHELVSILGERPGDKQIEEILKEEALERAKVEAEEELKKINAEELKKIENKSINDCVDSAFQPIEIPVVETANEQSCEKPESQPKPNVALRPIKQLTIDEQRSELIKRKSQEIYQHQLELENLAIQEDIKLQEEWQKQQEKVRIKDEELRQIREKAKAEYEAINNVPEIKEDTTKSPEKPTRPPKSKSLKLKMVLDSINRTKTVSSFEELKKWFFQQQWSTHKLFNNAESVSDWFHGCISRDVAEKLVDNEPGSFLIRVSDKFLGFILTLKAKSRIKHILIECGDKGFQFCGGTNMKSFEKLSQMVDYFMIHPISDDSKDILVKPIGQLSDKNVDYLNLIQPTSSENNATF